MPKNPVKEKHLGAAKPRNLTKKDQAKLMFFAYVEPEEICRRLELPYYTLKRWIAGYENHVAKKKIYRHVEGWKFERANQLKELQTNVANENKFIINKIYKVGFPLVYNSLVHLAKTDTKLSLRDMRDLSAVLTAFDKLIRLEDGKATDIVKHEPMTIEDIKKVFEEDYFIDVSNYNNHIKKEYKPKIVDLLEKIEDPFTDNQHNQEGQLNGNETISSIDGKEDS